MPIKTKLILDYEVDWGYQSMFVEKPARNQKEITIYLYK
jgi:hypothetical protein